MKIKWTTFFILVNFFGQLTNCQKNETEIEPEKEVSANITNIETASEKTSTDKEDIPDLAEKIKKEEEDLDLPKTFACSNPTTDLDRCPSEIECDKLGNECLSCNCTLDCIYGQLAEAQCTVPEAIVCNGSRTFTKKYTCAFCYQAEEENISCNDNVECDSVFDPKVGRHYTANCSVDNSLICMGRRNFPKRIPCNWTGGHRWLTALILSITLGGFGADRFYLGHWQEGIGKLFSFGGLGVWTLVDVVMIAVRYVGPSDGSLYI